MSRRIRRAPEDAGTADRQDPEDGPGARSPTSSAQLYTDTPEGLIEMAQRQTHAHLLKLKAEGKVEGSSVKAAWSLVG